MGRNTFISGLYHLGRVPVHNPSVCKKTKREHKTHTHTQQTQTHTHTHTQNTQTNTHPRTRTRTHTHTHTHTHTSRYNLSTPSETIVPRALIEGFARHNYTLIGRKYQVKSFNDCISRSGHRLKVTQPNLMILVSFSSAEDAISNDVILLARKVLKIPRSAFFGHPVYTVYWGYRYGALWFSFEWHTFWWTKTVMPGE